MLQKSPSLGECLNQYLARLKVAERREEREELVRFVQWYGRDRAVGELVPSEVAEYAESAGMWRLDSEAKLKLVKSFLSHLKKVGLTTTGLAQHLRASRPKRDPRYGYGKATSERAQLTREGYASLQARLEMLKEERIKIIADIQRAMADKDFKENAPLDAAKERQGFIESGIRELEGVLTMAHVTDDEGGGDSQRVRLGTRVVLRDMSNNKEVHYTLVDSRESDPARGKISSVSPVGNALLDKAAGDEIQITVPKGTLRYVIQRMER